MRNRRLFVLLIALLGAIAGLLSVSARFLPVMLNRSPFLIGTLLQGIGLMLFVVSPLAVLGIGYWFGRNVTVPNEYRRIALMSGFSGGVASLGSTLTVVAFSSTVYPMETVPEVSGVLLMRAYQAVELGVEFAIASVAGAAIAHFSSEQPEYR